MGSERCLQYVFWAGFDDGTKWVVRFPIVGAIAPELIDEKLKTEIATMMFLCEKTTIAKATCQFKGSHPGNLVVDI
jgi:hypothetical protein